MSKDSRIARAISFRRIRAAKERAKYWRERWKTHPETMRANLDRLNEARKAKANARTVEKLRPILDRMPRTIPSWEFRQRIAEAIGHGVTKDHPIITRFLSAVRRRGLVRFDESTMSWLVAS